MDAPIDGSRSLLVSAICNESSAGQRERVPVSHESHTAYVRPAKSQRLQIRAKVLSESSFVFALEIIGEEILLGHVIRKGKEEGHRRLVNAVTTGPVGEGDIREGPLLGVLVWIRVIRAQE